MSKYTAKRIVIESIGTIIGAMFIAFGVASFLLPSQLSSGGVSGIATITYYLLNIPMGAMIMIINIPLFILAGYKIGKDFFIKSLIGTVSLSVFIDILDKYPPITTDRFLASIYGGVIIGIGTAIILKVGLSILLIASYAGLSCISIIKLLNFNVFGENFSNPNFLAIDKNYIFRKLFSFSYTIEEEQS